VDNASPCQSAVVRVHVSVVDDRGPVGGADLTSVWRYKTTTASATGATGSDGTGTLQRAIGHATAGYVVRVDVHAAAGSRAGDAQTSFTPRDC
jgi:hypothetical protein